MRFCQVKDFSGARMIVQENSSANQAAWIWSFSVSRRLFCPVPTLAVPVNVRSCCVQGNNAVMTMLGISVQQGLEPRPAGAPARVHTYRSLSGPRPAPSPAGRAHIRPGTTTKQRKRCRDGRWAKPNDRPNFLLTTVPWSSLPPGWRYPPPAAHGPGRPPSSGIPGRRLCCKF